jgi:hypothetical protein
MERCSLYDGFASVLSNVRVVRATYGRTGGELDANILLPFPSDLGWVGWGGCRFFSENFDLSVNLGRNYRKNILKEETLDG